MIGLFIGLLMMLVAIAAMLSVALGAGYAISLLLPMTLFQSTVVFTAVIAIGILIIGFMDIHEKIKLNGEFLRDLVGWDEDDYEDREEESERIKRIAENEARQSARKAVMNADCQCGSGRKFKYCCMKKKASPKNEEVIRF